MQVWHLSSLKSIALLVRVKACTFFIASILYTQLVSITNKSVNHIHHYNLIKCDNSNDYRHSTVHVFPKDLMLYHTFSACLILLQQSHNPISVIFYGTFAVTLAYLAKDLPGPITQVNRHAAKIVCLKLKSKARNMHITLNNILILSS